MWNSRKVVAIFGSSQAIEGDEAYRQARLLARLLARHGAVVCHGGYGGVMEAVSRGASEVEGISLGLTLGTFGAREANPFLTREIRSATLFERLATFVDLAEAFVVIRGGVGTLAEFSLVWNLMQTRQIETRPFIFVGDSYPQVIKHLRQNMEIRDKDLQLLRFVSSPEEAVDFLKDHLHLKQ